MLYNRPITRPIEILKNRSGNVYEKRKKDRKYGSSTTLYTFTSTLHTPHTMY